MTMTKRTFKIWGVEFPDDFAEESAVYGDNKKNWVLKTTVEEGLEPEEIKELIRMKLQRHLGRPVLSLEVMEVNGDEPEKEEDVEAPAEPRVQFISAEEGQEIAEIAGPDDTFREALAKYMGVSAENIVSIKREGIRGWNVTVTGVEEPMETDEDPDDYYSDIAFENRWRDYHEPEEDTDDEDRDPYSKYH